MEEIHVSLAPKRIVTNLGTTMAIAMTLGASLFTPAYAVDRATISDEFDGCDYGKVYPLDDGRVLVCEGYSYSYSYRPDVIVLDRSTVLIDGDEYDARVTEGIVITTKVDGEFEGCDYDKIIPFENGLLFECREYGYSYGYRADVLITKVDGVIAVTIDGDTYRGTLYQR